MNVGESYEITREVTPGLTAREFGSGGVDAFGTPAMIAFMEEASLTMVDSKLNEGKVTVGTSINVKHLAPTAVGDKVNVRATLEDIKDKKLVFSVEAYDSQNKIGEGTHERVIVDREKFMAMMSKGG